MKFSSIEDAKKYLIEYRDSIPEMTEKSLDMLAHEGAGVARARSSVEGTLGSHKMDALVDFTVVDNATDSMKASKKLVGTGEPFISTWSYGNKSATVYPMMMLEFGTGAEYDHTGDEYIPVTKSKTTNSDMWGFTDVNGNWKIATAISHLHPMHNAGLAMARYYADTFKRYWKH